MMCLSCMLYYQFKVSLIFIPYSFQGVNDMRMITPEQMSQIMTNLNHYLSYISVEATSPHWTNILVQFETFFRRLLTVMTSPSDFTAVFKVMVAVLKIPNINSVKVYVFTCQTMHNNFTILYMFT